MKRGKMIIFSFCILMQFFLVMTLGAIVSDKEVSEIENRALAKKPVLDAQGYFSGRYFKEWDNFISDHIPFRQDLILETEKVEAAFKVEKEATVVSVKADMGVQDKAKDVYINQELISVKGKLLEVYSFNDKTCKYYSKAANKLMSEVPENVNKYLMLVPTALEFEEEKYRCLADSQWDAIDYVYSRINKGVTCLDIYDNLQKHSGEYIYFRSDHHWTALGAYYGAQIFLESAGFEAYGIDKYKSKRLENYLGYLYNMAPSENIKKNPDYIDYYMMGDRNNSTEIFYYDENKTLAHYEGKVFDYYAIEDGNTNYGVFLGGDQPLIVVDGDMRKGRVLAIVKDSYGNAFIPWLTPYFQQIIVIDPRSYKGDFGELMKNYGVTDFILIDYMKATMLPGYVDYIDSLAGQESKKVETDL